MKLYMKQKVFSWTDKFNVVDENEQSKYYVEGEFLSVGKKLHIYNNDGKEVAFIRQKVLTFLPRFFVEIDGKVVATIVKEFTFLKQSYRLEGLPWHVDGDFFGHEYVVYDNQNEIMKMSKAWFTWGDSYEMEIFDEKNEILCLSVALAIDCALAQTNNSVQHN